MKNVKILNFEETGASYEQNLFLRTIPDKRFGKRQRKKIKQNWTRPTNFNNFFCVIFDHHY